MRKLTEEYDFDEPEEGDILIVDHPRRGYEAGEIDGKVFAMSHDLDEIYQQIRKWMKKHSFYPNVWFQDDHGGIELVTDLHESTEGDEMKRINEVKTFSYSIPEWAIPALINGDYSGLSRQDEKDLDDFLNRYSIEGKPGHWVIDDDEPHFARSNDVQNLGGNVVKATFVLMRENTQTKPISEASLRVFDKRDVESVLQGYLGAALFTEIDDEGEPLDYNYDISDFSTSARRVAEREITDFLTQVEKELPAEYLMDLPKESYNTGQATVPTLGHDFWLTRNGHGAGFWDGDWEPHGDTLTKIAERAGEAYLEVGDDGELYLR